MSYTGLNDAEIKNKLERFGLNELSQSPSRNFLNLCLEIFREPMFILLLLCCLLYLILGDIQEALILSVFVLVIIGITVFQSWKTEKTLDALKDLSNPKAKVIRNGQEITIESKFLVPEDILIIQEGDKIPADAIIVSSDNLAIDESLLTGESIPVHKEQIKQNGTANDQELHRVFSGTLVTQGHAYCSVIATGSASRLGSIGQSLSSISKEASRFQQEGSSLVSKMLVIDGVLCSLIIFIFWYFRNDLIKGLLTAITFAIAMIPEEIPAVLTIFMALGAWRISRNNVLTKKLPAIETLGSITVLCTDKTGTLTENSISLTELFTKGRFHKITRQEMIPEDFHRLCEDAILASKPNSHDPIEKAIITIRDHGLIDSTHVHQDWQSVHEYPLSKELFAMSRAWDPPDEKQENLVFAKGSPEAILDLCHLAETDKQEINTVIEIMAQKGLRILGVAKSKIPLVKLPANQHDIDFEFSGLLGFTDPVRQGVPEAIQDCYQAGIKVAMITGDHHITAQNVAQEIGLKDPQHYLTGKELEKLSDEELQKRIMQISIFSRVIPEQKLRIIKALKANNQTVGMTGDGVNDAPALKSADVGIAMGKRGTDVAREAADLVLLDDNFTSIVQAIKLGRRIFTNLSKAMSYILAIHIPIAGLTLIPVIFNGLPVIFFPIHVALLELIIDPTCSIVFENEPAHPNIMKQAPQEANEPILGINKILKSILQGGIVLAAVSFIYFFCLEQNLPDTQVRLISFGALLIGNLGLTLINKSWRYSSLPEFFKRNQSLLLIIMLILLWSLLMINIPFLKNIFYF